MRAYTFIASTRPVHSLIVSATREFNNIYNRTRVCTLVQFTIYTHRGGQQPYDN